MCGYLTELEKCMAGKKADAYYLWSEGASEEWWKYGETTMGANLKDFA